MELTVRRSNTNYSKKSPGTKILKTTKKTHLSELWDNITQSSTCVIEVPGEENGT